VFVINPRNVKKHQTVVAAEIINIKSISRQGSQVETIPESNEGNKTDTSIKNDFKDLEIKEGKHNEKLELMTMNVKKEVNYARNKLRMFTTKSQSKSPEKNFSRLSNVFK